MSQEPITNLFRRILLMSVAIKNVFSHMSVFK